VQAVSIAIEELDHDDTIDAANYELKVRITVDKA
jgi:hypothetical protein